MARHPSSVRRIGHYQTVHSRRARPTLRVLEEDLSSGWISPIPRRRLADGELDDLHPISELPHPIVAKAAEAFPHEPDSDNHVGAIACSTKLQLMEIRINQWRGGVWLDPRTGVHWLIVAGLAKGGHEDRDDFYERVARENDNDTIECWLPTETDTRLLKRETAARMVTRWELDVQRKLLETLRQTHTGGSARLEIAHPILTHQRLATLDLTIARVVEEGYRADEIVLEVIGHHDYVGSSLLWQMTMRALITLSPPEQGWDRYQDCYSTINDLDYFTERISALEALVTQGTLSESERGRHAHYTHRKHLAGRTIDGKAVRALCGAHFVPTQDHASLPCCPTCEQRLDELPAAQ